jgi:hypothetical protein
MVRLGEEMLEVQILDIRVSCFLPNDELESFMIILKFFP